VQDAIDLGFVQQLRVLGLHRFQFDRHLFARRHVGAQVYITEGSAADLAPQPVLLADAQFHGAYCFLLLLLLSSFVVVVVVVVVFCYFND